MLVFASSLKAGLRAAAMSGVEDGDCSFRTEARDNRERFFALAGVDPQRVVSVLQVHGNAVATANETDAGRGAWDRETALCEADGIVTATPGLPVCVSIADCAPVLLCCPKPRAVGVLHSGRESTFLNIAREGVKAMQREFRCEPAHIQAIVGPCISSGQYEVSTEIADRFRDAGYPVEGRHLDLPAIIRGQLMDCGVPENAILLTGICTFENHAYYSYRRDAGLERNVMVAMI